MIVITGGQGTLAQALRATFESESHQVVAPGRDTLDVRDAASVEAFFQQIPDPIDLLISQAAIIKDGPLVRMTEDDWDDVVDTNLKGAWLMARAFLASLAGRSGHLIQIGSYSGLSGPAGQANYAAAKAGLIGLTQSLARECGPQGVRVNAILPGFLETRMTESLTDAQRARFREEHVLGEFSTVNEVAKFVRFLHKDLIHTSGQVFQLDSRVRRPGW